MATLVLIDALRGTTPTHVALDEGIWGRNTVLGGHCGNCGSRTVVGLIVVEYKCDSRISINVDLSMKMLTIGKFRPKTSVS